MQKITKLFIGAGWCFLAGCSVSPVEKIVAEKTESAETREQELQYLQQCRQELQALKIISPELHSQRKSSFDNLMGSAAQYASIRKGVNRQTKDTVDALYQYKLNRLCASISQEVVTGLTDRGENAK